MSWSSVRNNRIVTETFASDPATHQTLTRHIVEETALVEAPAASAPAGTAKSSP